MFLEIEFPRFLALNGVGGPTYSTLVNMGFSGFEQRNQGWSISRAEYTVSFEHRLQADYDLLLSMFHAAAGMANAFRVWDPSDNTFTNEPCIDLGNGAYMLAKRYSAGGITVTRPIQKPIMSSIVDFFGNPLTDTVTLSDGVVDPTTGIVNGAGSLPTASGQYHVPCRFNLDGLSSSKETGVNNPIGVIYTVAGIKLIEIKIRFGETE